MLPTAKTVSTKYVPEKQRKKKYKGKKLLRIKDALTVDQS